MTITRKQNQTKASHYILEKKTFSLDLQGSLITHNQPNHDWWGMPVICVTKVPLNKLTSPDIRSLSMLYLYITDEWDKR